MKKKVQIVIGTRPEAIKMAPVLGALRKHSEIEVQLVSTGQHRDLLGKALSSFDLKPDIDLDTMVPGQSLADLTSRILTRMTSLLKRERPDLVLCHGDTTTAFTVGLACMYGQVPLMHVEAGLRSHRLDSPFPEEFNRRMLTQMATHHFAPGETEKEHLLTEGVLAKNISVVGNTIADSVQEVIRHIPPAAPGRNLLVTLHRREKSGDDVRNSLASLRQTAERIPDLRIHFPLHPNPAFREIVLRELSGLGQVELLPPLEYPQFLGMILKSAIVLTDSGGVQEEASLLGKPTLVMRDVTERETFGSTLVRPGDAETLERHVRRALSTNTVAGPPLARHTGASIRIARVVHERLHS